MRTSKVVEEVQNISVHFDNVMKMDGQVKSECKNAWINLSNVSKIWKYLTEGQTKAIVHAYIAFELDSSSYLLAGLINTEDSELQTQLKCLQNAAVKLTIQKKKVDHAAPLFHNIHWLRINYLLSTYLLYLPYTFVNNLIGFTSVHVSCRWML